MLAGETNWSGPSCDIAMHRRGSACVGVKFVLRPDSTTAVRWLERNSNRTSTASMLPFVDELGSIFATLVDQRS